MSASASQRNIRDLIPFLRSFLINPIGTMKSHIWMSYPANFTLIAGTAIISGSIYGIASRSFGDFIVGLFLFPITSILMALVFSFFIYYFFSLFQSTFLDFRRLLSIVSVAMLPFFLAHAVSGWLPPVDLIGFTFTALLLVVGLVEQFSLQKRVVVKLIGAIGVAFFLVWSVAQIRSGFKMPTEEHAPQPRSLDDLQRDLKTGN
jgi:hypothetical protein